jgi:hypothetical protein
MRNTVRIIGASLASMAGMLLVSGVASAQAEETPITWRNIGYQTLEEAERFWVEEENGIEHGRNEMYINPRRGDMVGDEIGWTNWDHDRATGDYFEHGYFAFTGTVRGKPGDGVGRYTVECHRVDGVRTCTGDDLMHLNRGGLAKTSTTYETPTSEPIFWSGTLLEPAGRRAGPRKRSR